MSQYRGHTGRRRQHHCLSAIVAGCFALSLSAGAHAQSLQSLIQHALDNHPKIKAARAATRGAALEIDQASAAWSPRINVIADPARTFRIGNSAAGGGSSQAGDIALRGTQLLYDGGHADAEIERQKARFNGAGMRVAAATEQLTAQIADLYLEAAKQTRLAHAAAANVQAHNALVSRVAEIAKVDTGRRSELTQAQARADQARVQQQQREAAATEARAQIASITGRAVATIQPVPSAASALPVSEEQARNLLDVHPSVLAARADADAARQAANSAAAWDKPRVDVQGTLQRDPFYASGHYARVADVRLLANWTGFDGGAGRAAAAAAHEQAQAAIDTSDAVGVELAMDIARNWAGIETRKLRLPTWLNLSRQLEDLREGHFEQFKNGRRSILDMLNLETEIYQARSGLESDSADIEQLQYRLLGATAQLTSFLGLNARAP